MNGEHPKGGSKRHFVGARISEATYRTLDSLNHSSEFEFDSISEYISYLIEQDLMRRVLGTNHVESALLSALRNPRYQDELRNTFCKDCPFRK